jgi:hypothetical protein
VVIPIVVAVSIVVAVAVVFTIPVTFMHVPAVLVVVIVGVTPVRPLIGRAIPTTWDPDIAASIDTPVAVNPDEAFARRRGTPLNAQRWRSAAYRDAESDLGGCGDGGGNAGCYG